MKRKENRQITIKVIWNYNGITGKVKEIVTRTYQLRKSAISLRDKFVVSYKGIIHDVVYLPESYGEISGLVIIYRP